MDYRKFTELQIDALREVGNIGAGNAATALSQMIQKRIDMSVPEAAILPLEEMIQKIGNEEDMVVAVIIRVFGDAPGNMVFLLTMNSAHELLKMLLDEESEGDLTEMQISALQEIGNILTGAYINSIVKLTGMMLVSSVPAISVDMLYSLMTTAFIESGQFDEYIMSIEAKFIMGKKNIKGYFFYIPKPGSLEKLIQTLGLA
jgi:chemotaxis protein CheC